MPEELPDKLEVLIAPGFPRWLLNLATYFDGFSDRTVYGKFEIAEQCPDQCQMDFDIRVCYRFRSERRYPGNLGSMLIGGIG